MCMVWRAEHLCEHIVVSLAVAFHDDPVGGAAKASRWAAMRLPPSVHRSADSCIIFQIAYNFTKHIAVKQPQYERIVKFFFNLLPRDKAYRRKTTNMERIVKLFLNLLPRYKAYCIKITKMEARCQAFLNLLPRYKAYCIKITKMEARCQAFLNLLPRYKVYRSKTIKMKVHSRFF
jgi:hypothetical protein